MGGLQTIVNLMLLLAVGALACVAFTAAPPARPVPLPPGAPGEADLEADLCVQAGTAGRVAYLMGECHCQIR